MNQDLLYQPLILSIMPTWQCTANCANCGTYSSPRVKTRLAREQIIAAITTAADEGFRLVVFTGGEATLRWRELVDGIACASARGLATRLVTNGWWGRSAGDANRRMKELAAAGLKEVNLSTGDEHSRFVPLASLATAVRAAMDHGFRPIVMIELTREAGVSAATIAAIPEFAPLLLEHADEIEFIESPWMPLDPDETGSYPDGVIADADNVRLRDGCESIFSTHTLQADGSMGLCCGLGMSKLAALHSGRFGEDVTSFRAAAALGELDTVKLAVRQLGPERTLARLSTLNPAVDWSSRFGHKCQACVYLFSSPEALATAHEYADTLLAELSAEMVLERIAIVNGIS